MGGLVGGVLVVVVLEVLPINWAATTGGAIAFFTTVGLVTLLSMYAAHARAHTAPPHLLPRGLQSALDA